MKMGILIYSPLFIIFAFVPGTLVFGQSQVPQIHDYSALFDRYFEESQPKDSYIGTIIASVSEGGLEYFITGQGAEYFEIGRYNGNVTLKKILDYDRRNTQEISMTITVRSLESGLSETIDTQVYVDDVNDELPVFINPAQFKEISEANEPGLEVAIVSVTDVDTTNNLLTVKCIGDTPNFRDACDKFGLEFKSNGFSNKHWSGKLVLKKKLDFETRKSYAILLEANDGANVQTDEIHVEVIDVNDTPPRWVLTQDVSIPEEVPLNVPITRVSAVDPDTESQQPIYYEVIGENSGKFTIYPETGEIAPIIRLDFDDVSVQGELSFDVTIRASEILSRNPLQVGNDSSTTATTVVTVTVEDIDDNDPTFDQDPYRVKIREDIEIRANLPGLQMTVTDIDSGNFNSFDLLVMSFDDIFGIIPGKDAKSSSATLYIKNSETIDYEQGTREYKVLVMARENLVTPARSGTSTVIIEVLDVNDEVPKFTQSSYQTEVYENAKEGSFVIAIQATDREVGSFGTAGIRYQLFGNQLNHFKIDERTGVITTESCLNPGDTHGDNPCIDYERRKSYVLSVSATDDNGNGQKTSTQVIIKVIDVNDNIPQLKDAYVAYIYEEETITVNPLIIDAQDPDTVGGPLTYTLVGDTGPFQITAQGVISATVGNITAKRPVLYSDADDPASGSVKFQVQVADKKNQQTASVEIFIIDINNNAPEFVQPEYIQWIPEDTLGDVNIVAITANDGDAATTGNGQLEFDITGAKGKFDVVDLQLNGTLWYARIITSADATFNYETQSLYEMQLVARDRGTPTSKTGVAKLTVHILDINNKAPQITPPSSSIAVSEHLLPPTLVHTIIADDPDATSELRYTFEATNAQNPVGEPVDKNVYDYTKLFTLDDITGQVRINSPLNRDSASFITYRLLVVDINGASQQTGTGALFITILEYNDQSPQFQQSVYDITIDEELNRNYFVENLKCTDADDKIAGYSIRQTIPPFPNFFSLIENSGAMIVNNRIDYEQIQYIELEGRCEDNGNPRLSNTTRIKVNIRNINDNSPIFDRLLYQSNLKEKTEIFTPVVTVTATDIDLEDYGVVRYRMADPSLPFSINETTGEIIVSRAGTFDRETKTSFSFQVIAYDSPNTPNEERSTRVPVYIYVEDINDNCPIFTEVLYEGSLPESAPTGTDIIDVIANDLDSGSNGAISFSITPGSGQPPESVNYFAISSDSGRIKTQDNLKKRSGIYYFNVTATDMKGEQPVPPACASQVSIKIEVTESENNPPVFRNPPVRDFAIEVLESQYEGMLVYNAKATDVDKGQLGVVDYFFLVNGEPVSKTPDFRINQITGVIRAEIEYDREDIDRYFLTLLARDKGNPAASSRTTLTVIILDVDDNDPKFPLQNGEVIPLVLPKEPLNEETEPGPNGIYLGTCNAVDLDSDVENNRIYYELYAPGDVISEFIRVNRINCDMYLIKKVNFEDTPTLRFNIIAFNERSDDTVRRQRRNVSPSIQPVVINIVNKNDNPPVFSESHYMACAYQNTPFLQNILYVEVKDFDGLSEPQLSLDGTNAFTIDNTGVIKNIQSFYTTTKEVHMFTVKAKNGDNVETATAKVTIFIVGPDNQVRIKQNRPRLDTFNTQAAARITEENSKIFFTCAKAEDFITPDGQVSLFSSELLVAAVQKTDPNRDSYHVYTSAELLNILEGRGEYISLEKEDNDEFSLSEDSVIVIFVLCILLIIIAIFLFCLACYCIRDKKKKKTKKIKAQRQTIIQVTPEREVANFENPVYHNQGYTSEEPEYASVMKTRPIAPVVIAAPENLEPLESTYQPTELVPDPESQISEPEPVIETEVLPAEEPEYTPRSTEPEFEDRIETIVVEDEIPAQEPESPIEDDFIEVEFKDETPEIPPSSDDMIDVEILDELPLPSPPPEEREFTIETSIEDS